MPVLLHGGMVCPLELAAVLGGFGSVWSVALYVWHKVKTSRYFR